MANTDGLKRMISAWGIEKLGDIADEFVDTARAIVAPHSKSGDLAAGIQVSSIVGGEGKSQSVVRSTARHAKWQNDGTGVFGPEGQPIMPVTANVLVFEGHDGMVFRHSVKGSPALHYWEDTIADWSGICARAMNR